MSRAVPYVPCSNLMKGSGVSELKQPWGDRVADKWNAQAGPRKRRTNYWQFPAIVGELNLKVCGQRLPGVSHGIASRLSRMGQFEHAVSVGCGMASKERNLLSRNIVQRFDLFDLAGERLAVARKQLAKAGLEGRAFLTCGDAFARTPHEKYDLICWHSSLHHMPDAFAALDWSRRVLKPGGVFAMWEYTGPTRWQWTDRNLENVNAFRAALPPKFRPEKPTITRPTIPEMMARDPSEAADSANIRPAVLAEFPDAELIDLGGALYSFGLRGIWPKIGPKDTWFLRLALAFDQAMIDDNLVTCAFARKARAT